MSSLRQNTWYKWKNENKSVINWHLEGGGGGPSLHSGDSEEERSYQPHVWWCDKFILKRNPLCDIICKCVCYCLVLTWTTFKAVLFEFDPSFWVLFCLLFVFQVFYFERIFEIFCVCPSVETFERWLEWMTWDIYYAMCNWTRHLTLAQYSASCA